MMMKRGYAVFSKKFLHYLLGVYCIFCVPSSALAWDRYVIDGTHTYSVFEYLHWGLSIQQGRFDKNSGWIEFDADKRSGKVDLVIDATSISTGSSLFDTALRSSGFFETDVHPLIHFKSDSLVFDDAGKVIAIEGDLSIKNVSKKVRFELIHFHCRFMPLYFKTACGANGYAKVLRSEFGLGRYAPFVSDEVTLRFAIEAIRE